MLPHPDHQETLLLLLEKSLPILRSSVQTGFGSSNIHKVYGRDSVVAPGCLNFELSGPLADMSSITRFRSSSLRFFTRSLRSLGLLLDLDSCTMRARWSPASVQSLQSCLIQFRTGRLVHVSLCRTLMGLMAAASPVVQLGVLHMRPLQWWIESQEISPHCQPLC